MGKAQRVKAKKRKEVRKEEDLLKSLESWSTDAPVVPPPTIKPITNAIFEGGIKKPKTNKKAKRNKKKKQLLAEKSLARNDVLQQKLLSLVEKKAKKEKWTSIY